MNLSVTISAQQVTFFQLFQKCLPRQLEHVHLNFLLCVAVMELEGRKIAAVAAFLAFAALKPDQLALLGNAPGFGPLRVAVFALRPTPIISSWVQVKIIEWLIGPTDSASL